jgi:hypothetical protein
MARLIDPKHNGKYPFAYTPADKTNIRIRFRRVKAEQLNKQDIPAIIERLRRKK